MDLVLADIATWKSQLEDELERINEQREKLDETEVLAKTKIKEAGELLDKMGYVAPTEETVEEKVAVQ
jgi:hypothetical protein